MTTFVHRPEALDIHMDQDFLRTLEACRESVQEANLRVLNEKIEEFLEISKEISEKAGAFVADRGNPDEAAAFITLFSGAGQIEALQTLKYLLLQVVVARKVKATYVFIMGHVKMAVARLECFDAAAFRCWAVAARYLSDEGEPTKVDANSLADVPALCRSSESLREGLQVIEAWESNGGFSGIVDRLASRPEWEPAMLEDLARLSAEFNALAEPTRQLAAALDAEPRDPDRMLKKAIELSNRVATVSEIEASLCLRLNMAYRLNAVVGDYGSGPNASWRFCGTVEKLWWAGRYTIGVLLGSERADALIALPWTTLRPDSSIISAMHMFYAENQRLRQAYRGPCCAYYT